MTVDLDKFAGCLIGQCLGDALGFIVEGESPAICQQYVDAVVRPGNTPGQRRGRFPFGQYSDDSQLAREFLISVVDRGRFEAADYASRIAVLFRENRIVGRGHATSSAAERLIQGVPWDQAGEPSPSAGNGSAMRAGPAGLLCFRSSGDLIRTAHDQGRITHQDRRCSAGAIAVAGAVALALQVEFVNVREFVAQLSAMTEAFDPILASGLRGMPRWLGQSPSTAATEISSIGLAPALDEKWPGISPFVTPSVLWSIYSFLKSPDDYIECICTAIAVGGDVDTTAAMAGAISGARVGLGKIPQRLARQLNDDGAWGHEELVGLTRRFHSVVNKE